MLSAETEGPIDGWLCFRVYNEDEDISVEEVLSDSNSVNLFYKCYYITGRNVERTINATGLSGGANYQLACLGQTMDNRPFASTTDMLLVEIVTSSEGSSSHPADEDIEEEEETAWVLLIYQATLTIAMSLPFFIF